MGSKQNVKSFLTNRGSIMNEGKAIFDKQVGGDHYKKLAKQPMDVVVVVSAYYNGAAGAMFKHLLRFPYKGQAVQDLEKAVHELEIASHYARYEMETYGVVLKSITDYVVKNEVSPAQAKLLLIAIDDLENGTGNFVKAVKDYKDNLPTVA